MAQYTQHYGLHQWEPGDSFLRTEFNEDLAKIDTALKGKADQSALNEISGVAFSRCQLFTGSFRGDGAAERVIELGTRPMAVVVCSETNMFASLVTGSVPLGPLAIVSNGFKTGTGGNIPQNVEGVRYYFMALR